jgi:hypothetical protein
MTAAPQLLTYIAGGIVAGMVATHVLEPPLGSWRNTPSSDDIVVSQHLLDSKIQTGVDRSAKGDRLMPRPTESPVPAPVVSSVELIGLSNTTIIYRDRSGSVLFRSDPITNTTIVVKNVALPVVTVRAMPKSPVQRQTIDLDEQKAVPQPAKCESPTSPIVNPDSRGLIGRCFAQLTTRAYH